MIKAAGIASKGKSSFNLPFLFSLIVEVKVLRNWVILKRVSLRIILW
jgi:hypothetical protein